jgi:IMP cyclohydrolase
MQDMVLTTAGRARRNFAALAANDYPGRGLIVGRDSAANFVQLYFMSGRSEGSRNRVLRQGDRGRIFTAPFDPSREVGNPDLTLYDAFNERGVRFVVSNGKQTDAVTDIGDMQAGLREWSFEDDPPNHTPRITGLCRLRTMPHVEIGVLRRGANGARLFVRKTYDNVPNGFGYGVHTYFGNGDPLPCWKGKPLLFPLEGDGAEIARTYWGALNPEFRVAIAVKVIEPHNGREVSITIINAHQK